MEITLLSYLSAVLRVEWNLTSTQAASISSCVFAGQFVGTLILGPLGDRIGRRPVFILTAAIITTFGIATAIVSNYASLLIVRTLLGFGVGGFVVPFDILTEFLPAERRGTHLLAVEYFWTFGSLLVSFCAYITIGSGGTWNVFVLLCSIPALVAVISAFCCVPESPRWLVAEGRKSEALAILRQAAVKNGKDPMVLFPHEIQIADDDEVGKSSFTELLKVRDWNDVVYVARYPFLFFGLSSSRLLFWKYHIYSQSGETLLFCFGLPGEFLQHRISESKSACLH